MFKENKLSLAVKLALASTMVFTLSGCPFEGDESVSRSGGSVTQVMHPKGTVVGLVQDTNGNPLSGIGVFLAGLNTTTDAGGNYRFTDVGVINAAGADADTNHNPLSVTIAAPTGFLGATVTVEPNAQIDGLQDDAAFDSTPSIFIDGFLAQAGTAVLPALTSTVMGVLRNDDTGAPLANTEIALDMEEVNDVSQQQRQDGVRTTYQTLSYTATTDANGVFTINNAPSDAELRFVVASYRVVGVSANTPDGDDVRTNDEVELVDVGNVYVDPILALDDQEPKVLSVDGVLNPNVTVGVFNDDITGAAGSEIVINFTEPMADLVDANSVFVRDVSNDVFIAGTVATDFATGGSTLTFTAAAAIPEGAELRVVLLRADFQDIAGNFLDVEVDNVDFDSIEDTFTAGGEDSVVHLALQIFQSINDQADPVTLAQQAVDANGATNDNAAIQALSVSWNDVEDDDNGIQQLNSADNDDGFNGADTEERLDAYLAEIGGTGGVQTDVTRVSFTPSNASQYEVKVFDDNGNEVLLYNAGGNPTNRAEITSDNGGFDLDTDNDGSVISNTGATVVELVIAGVRPGDRAEVTPFDDFGFPGTSDSLILVDNVEPTTILQQSYGASPRTDRVLSIDFGEGGQLANTDTEAPGTPILNVTAQLIDNLDANGDNLAAIAAGPGGQDNEYLAELMFHNTVDATNCNPIPNPCVNPTSGIYDSTAYSVLAANLDRTIGVAISENLASVGAPTYSGSAGLLSNYAPHNNVTLTDAVAGIDDNGDEDLQDTFNANETFFGVDLNNDGDTLDVINVSETDQRLRGFFDFVDPNLAGTTNADLVNVDVSNVLTLASEGGSVINFQDQMTDTAGNTASAANNARVVIRDAMPPMVTSSTYNGTSIVINFNEAIVPTTDTTVTIGTVSFDLSQPTVDAHPAGSSTLTIVTTDANWLAASGAGGFYGELRHGPAPAPGIDNFASLNYDDGAGLAFHGPLDFSEVADVNGNTWEDDNAGITVPLFAYGSTVPDVLTVTEASTTAAWTLLATDLPLNTAVVFTYTSNHAINMFTTFGVAGDATNLTNITGVFAFSAGVTTGTASLSANRRILTVTAQSDAIITTGVDTFAPVAAITFKSDYDNTRAPITAGDLTLTKP